MGELPYFPSDSADLFGALERLHRWAGRPGPRRLRALGGTVTRGDGEVGDALPVAATSDVLRRRTRPRPEFVDAFVTACLRARAVPPDEMTVVLASWRPARARTSQEFVEQLRSVKGESGLTYRQLARKAEANGDVLPIATLSSALTRTTLPRAAVVSAFLRACGRGPEEVEGWLAARHRLATAPHHAIPEQGYHEPARRQSRRGIAVALLACFLLVGLTTSTPGLRAASPPAEGRCTAVLRMGDTGDCVVTVQSLLVRAGLTMPVDGVYGPYTKMKVSIFQLHAGLVTTGVMDERTLRALRTGATRIETWSTDQVERRLREVFPEDADRVAALVRCLTDLDPLWVMTHADGSRNWGLFQLSDREVVFDYQGTYLTALDPEWNIRTARAIRDATGGLARWTCPPGKG
ncbi:peptidoglycan-binding domain-containing protein [Actinophytocola sp.]|uniref:peptidoglycan-binding domain-containing protein n=1 Tax=Actinophytocola sp. TaxID=1872138 RepID=UPI002ED0E11B